MLLHKNRMFCYFFGLIWVIHTDNILNLSSRHLLLKIYKLDLIVLLTSLASTYHWCHQFLKACHSLQFSMLHKNHCHFFASKPIAFIHWFFCSLLLPKFWSCSMSFYCKVKFFLFALLDNARDKFHCHFLLVQFYLLIKSVIFCGAYLSLAFIFRIAPKSFTLCAAWRCNTAFKYVLL